MRENPITRGLNGDKHEEYDILSAIDMDYFDAFSEITIEERKAWESAREFGESVRETMYQAWNDHHYPLEVAEKMGQAGLFAVGIKHPDIPELSPMAAGLITMEISRIDGSLGTIMGVQGGLALRTLVQAGSKEQHDQYLKPLLEGEMLGSFALTEPDHGSDSVALETTAHRNEAGHWVINGAKKWIGNGAAGGITFVFARIDDENDEAHGQVAGFIIPQDAEGYEAEPVRYKGLLRGIDQAHIGLRNVTIPESAKLPGIKKFSDVSKVLLVTRYEVAWSALGHATAAFETALNYAKQRVQFGRKLGELQMIQERLVRMLGSLTSMQLYCKQLADLEAAGELKATQASLAKHHCTRLARDVARDARDMLGGNGILLENGVIQHMVDLEASSTYEGTESVQALIVGRDITGFSAFN